MGAVGFGGGDVGHGERAPGGGLMRAQDRGEHVRVGFTAPPGWADGWGVGGGTGRRDGPSPPPVPAASFSRTTANRRPAVAPVAPVGPLRPYCPARVRRPVRWRRGQEARRGRAGRRGRRRAGASGAACGEENPPATGSGAAPGGPAGAGIAAAGGA